MSSLHFVNVWETFAEREGGDHLRQIGKEAGIS